MRTKGRAEIKEGLDEKGRLKGRAGSRVGTSRGERTIATRKAGMLGSTRRAGYAKVGMTNKSHSVWRTNGQLYRLELDVFKRVIEVAYAVLHVQGDRVVAVHALRQQLLPLPRLA